MELIAVPTGVNNRVAAYAYRGGSVFDRRDFYIGAALIKHPRGDLLVDAGFGRDIARQFATMPRYFRAITRYQVWKPRSLSIVARKRLRVAPGDSLADAASQLRGVVLGS